MNREEMLQQVKNHESKKWDVVIIGGGATGLGCAVDAASRGFKTLLLEKFDFAKGTSSKSTKLVHGGVRYLAQGNIKLVKEALKERGHLIKNAPHLVNNLSFLIPAYKWGQRAKYYTGMYMYDTLARSESFGAAQWLGKKEMNRELGNLRQQDLRGGVLYHDGQFDDTRLAINLAQTAADHHATVLNYAEVTGFIKDEKGKITGLRFTDTLDHTSAEVLAKSVINATGVFADQVLQMDEPGKPHTIIPSQGAHIVVDKKFLPGHKALMIPKTSDGRVLFVIPWHGKCVIGTTDQVVEHISIEPRPLEQEIDFILQTAKEYLETAPGREDILSVYAGLRPLAAPSGKKGKTRDISRHHKIFISPSGLINITGGKWTTYRKMAEDTLDAAIIQGRLIHSRCKTEHLPVHGFAWGKDPHDPLFIYGSDADLIHKLYLQEPSFKNKVHPDLPYTWGEIYWALKEEMAQTVEDVLARRTRAILLNAKASIACADEVARFMAKHLHKDAAWEQEQIKNFMEFARGYTWK